MSVILAILGFSVIELLAIGFLVILLIIGIVVIFKFLTRRKMRRKSLFVYNVVDYYGDIILSSWMGLLHNDKYLVIYTNGSYALVDVNLIDISNLNKYKKIKLILTTTLSADPLYRFARWIIKTLQIYDIEQFMTLDSDNMLIYFMKNYERYIVSSGNNKVYWFQYAHDDNDWYSVTNQMVNKLSKSKIITDKFKL